MIDVSKYTRRQLLMDVGYLRDKWRRAEEVLAELKRYGASPKSIKEAERRALEYKQDYEAIMDAIKKG